MSKNIPAKSSVGKTGRKKNYRLRKSVRRTLGALFLISAIIVAAIPFPDAAAADPAAGAGGSATATANSDFIYNTPSNDTAIDFGGANLDGSQPAKKALVIRQGSSGEYMLYKQFDYCEATFDGQQRGYIKKYNSLYAAESVELTENIYAEYYTVSEVDYNNFFATGQGSIEKKLIKNNLVDEEFFKYFYPTDYDEYIRKYAEWERNGSTSGSEPELKKTPKTDMSETQKLEYYCYEKLGQMYGFTLVKVNDKSQDTSGAANTYIYVARTNDGVNAPGGMTKDTLGFLVQKTASIIAIGEEAFSNISNVKYITLPEEIKYIADGAFANSFIVTANLKGVKSIGNKAFVNSTQLSSVTLGGAEVLGTEAFKGCSNLTTVELPWSLKKIGDGAFADCVKLNNVDLSTISAPNASIGYGAFYNCALGNLKIGNSSITTLGEGAFACTNAGIDKLTNVDMSENNTINTFKDKVFAGRTQLKTVVMPGNYGSTSQVTLPSSVFNRCSNLETVIFPQSCGQVKYEDDAKIFSEVTNPQFVVEGPPKDNYGQTAVQREGTWKAVNANGDPVPYTYVENGVTYYEVKSDKYLITLTVDKGNNTAVVYNCKVADPNDPPTDGKLTIPDNVGPYQVMKLGDGSLDQSVKDTIKNLTIGNSITEIGDQVFEGCTNMKTLVVGDGVTTIGTRAFYGCTGLEKATIGSGVTNLKDEAFGNCIKLTEIEFKSPSGGASSLPVENIGTGALETGSNKLTITGIINEAYGPFVYAMDPNNYVKSSDGIRICYKSPDPTRLTVILDNRNNLPTLVDYPKYDDLKEIIVDEVDNNGTPTGGSTNLLLKYESGQALTPAEQALINSTLYVDIPAGIKSIDVRGYLTDTSKQTVSADGRIVSNNYNVASYFNNPTTYKYGEQYKKYGLFNGNLVDNSVTSEEERGDDNLRSITMHTVEYLPTVPENGLDPADKEMSGGAFYSCENLETVSLGNTMEDVGELPFLGCNKLSSIASESPKYVCDNKILYENLIATAGGNQTGGKRIVECLATRGNAGDAIFNIENDPALAEVVEIADGAFMRCKNLGNLDLTGTPQQLDTIPQNAFKEDTGLVEVTLPSNIRIISDGAFEDTAENIRVSILGKEVDVKNEAFKGNKAIVRTYKDTAAYNAAKGIPNVTVVAIEDTYKVSFYNSVDGSLIKVDYVNEGGRADVPADEELPTISGMKFTGWSSDAYKNVTEDLIIMALYAADGTGGTGGNGNNGGTGGNNGTGGTGGNGNNGGTGGTGGNNNGTGTGDYDADGNRLYTLTVTGGNGSGKYKAGAKVSIMATGGNTGTTFGYWSSSSNGVIFDDSTKSTTSLIMPANDATVIANYAGQYRLEVKYGSGSGSYAAGTKVSISAVEAPAGKKFYRWATNTTGLTIESSTSTTTTITMPASNATVEATYTNTNAATGGTGTGNGTTGTTGTSSNNKTSVVITRPGISDTDQASAYVSGSTDGFVVKITESPEATEAALAALEREYPDMTRIKFAAMDISLYDATGANKITDTTGLKVNITMPIPDALRTYAGNNKIAGVVDGSLDKLGVKFVTMNGVPSMSFTATHFSPYVVYVDTGNLVAGNVLDQTPQTGDGIHPKWFLSIGLASISMILFLKRDPKYKTRIS